MPLKATILASLLLLLSHFTQGQDFQKKFKDLFAKGDTTAQAQLLKEWTVANPKDPELFICYFNFYVKKSKIELISLDKEQKSEEAMVVTDTGTGKPVGYLNSSMHYNSPVLQTGFDYIDKGIALYPTRLDMRFGKVYMLGEARNFPEFTRVLIETIDYGNTIKNAWLWKDGKPLEDAKNFFLSSMQSYSTTIYNAEDDNLLPYMRQISEAVVKYYPDHVESLDNIAVTYLLTGDYDSALPYLLRAEKIAPKDVIVLGNIAEAYKRKNDKANAKIYYEKVIKYGSKEEAEDAKERLKTLF